MRVEWGAGLVASMIANVNRDPKHPPFTPTDFTLHFTKVKAVDGPISLWGSALKTRPAACSRRLFSSLTALQ
ncbi:hypothetical protein ACVN7A_20360 [Escherichia coli]|uniref:hypothetical protein n=1 Tax=Escherichia coli TaxID=562 RepID=UPI003C6D21A9